MGLTLARARKGTSSGAGGGKLAYNSVNEALLNRIIDWVHSYSSSHPGEASLKFKSAMSWPTALQLDDFSAGSFEQRGDDMVSTETIGNDNLPVIRFHKDSDGQYKMSVLAMKYLDQVLNIAKGRKLDEARACLDANPDPLACVAGERFSSVNGEDLSTYRYMEEIMKSPREDPEDGETETKKLVLRLVMHVQKLDSDLLLDYADASSSMSRLTPSVVEQDVNLIKEFCGEDEEKHVLEDIAFTTDYKFKDGSRASMIRQVHGDIAYIEVKPHDEDPFYVTAGTSGYFVNKGWVKAKNDIDFERVGDIIPNLVELLKTKSQKFAELIVKQPWDELSAKKTKKKNTKNTNKPQTVDGKRK